MTTVRDIYNALFAFAPASMKMDWDNVGLLCGRFDAPVDTVLVALDPMPDVIDEAKKTGAQCIVTHHPLFFDAPRAVNDASYEGRCILELAEAKIAAINLHTNLDVCPGGVNDVLAETLGLTEVSVLNPTGTDAQGRPTASSAPAWCGSSPFPNSPRLSNRRSPAPDFGSRTRESPCGAWLSAAGAAAARSATVLAAGCDTLVTADLKYNHFEEAKYRGLNLIDAGHFETENPVCAVLERVVREALPELTVLRAKAHKDETQFL
ncbi:MAG: Nif3-like dinuclear metal center hexameric protein [Acutalibacteraceae bacterium]